MLLLGSSFVTFTADHATFNNMALLYIENLERKQFHTEVRVTNNIKDVLNIEIASCKFLKNNTRREIHSNAHISKAYQNVYKRR